MDTRGFIKTTAADKTSPLRLQNVNSNQQCVTPATSIFYLQSLTETQANVEWNQFLLHCCCLKRRTSLCSLYISQRLWDTFSVISVFLTVSHVWQAQLTGSIHAEHSDLLLLMSHHMWNKLQVLVLCSDERHLMFLSRSDSLTGCWSF